MIYLRANAGHADRCKQIRVDWHSLTNVREGTVGGVDRVQRLFATWYAELTFARVAGAAYATGAGGRGHGAGLG